MDTKSYIAVAVAWSASSLLRVGFVLLYVGSFGRSHTELWLSSDSPPICLVGSTCAVVLFRGLRSGIAVGNYVDVEDEVLCRMM
jgi:hypothetical protein